MKWYCQVNGTQVCLPHADPNASKRHWPCPDCCGFTTHERQQRLQQRQRSRRLLLGTS